MGKNTELENFYKSFSKISILIRFEYKSKNTPRRMIFSYSNIYTISKLHFAEKLFCLHLKFSVWQSFEIRKILRNVRYCYFHFWLKVLILWNVRHAFEPIHTRECCCNVLNENYVTTSSVIFTQVKQIIFAFSFHPTFFI
jgi:hypothetical protein